VNGLDAQCRLSLTNFHTETKYRYHKDLSDYTPIDVMKKTNIVFLDRSTLPEQIKLNNSNPNINWVNHSLTPSEQVIKRSQDADIIVTNKVIINRDTLAACPKLKHIAVAATGFNIIDIDACREYGVSVSNISNYASTSVPEHVLSLILNLRRELLQYRQQVIQGKWQSSPHFCLFDKPINDLKNSTLGIIGFGELGKATASLAHALGMRVIYTSRQNHHSTFADKVSLEELLCTADIVSIHCSLNDDTKDMIGETELAMMKPSAILINTARGGIVNEYSVVQSIKNRQIAAIGSFNSG